MDSYRRAAVERAMKILEPLDDKPVHLESQSLLERDSGRVIEKSRTIVGDSDEGAAHPRGPSAQFQNAEAGTVSNRGARETNRQAHGPKSRQHFLVRRDLSAENPLP